MTRKLYCGSACVKYILEHVFHHNFKVKYNMVWATELAICFKENGINDLQVYCFNSKLYNDFLNKKIDLNFEGFKYLKILLENNINIKEKKITSKTFLKEIDSCKYIILCVESKIFNSIDSMIGGHYIIINGRNGSNINVINPVKEMYEIRYLNIDFLIKACKNYGAWRILIKGEK